MLPLRRCFAALVRGGLWNLPLLPLVEQLAMGSLSDAKPPCEHSVWPAPSRGGDFWGTALNVKLWWKILEHIPGEDAWYLSKPPKFLAFQVRITAIGSNALLPR